MTYDGPHFDMICVGTGGGPDESNLTSYIFKSYHETWDSGSIAIDAGSGIGALSKAIQANPEMLDDLRNSLPDESCSASSAYPPTTTKADTRQDVDGYRLASRIFSSITSYLITHPHLDHLAGLIINSSQKFGSYKSLIGFEKTLKGVELAFGGLLWPALASWSKAGGLVERLQFTQVEPFAKFDVLTPAVTFKCTPFPISHGTIGLVPDARTHAYLQVEKDPNEVYDSIAYFIEFEHQEKNRSFLFWGDVEPDAISTLPRNKPVWIEAAKRFVLGELRWIWIECSYMNNRPNNLLFGHFKPDLLIDELETLAIIVEKFKQLPVEELKNVNATEFSIDEYINESKMKDETQSVSQDSVEDDENGSVPLSQQANQASQAVRKALFGGLNHALRIGYNKGFGFFQHTTEKPLDGLVIAITHVKEDPMLGCDVVSETIMRELHSNSSTEDLGVKFYRPKQGERIMF
ncbi:hypothetical protein E3Q22_04153 [Wallemia mellicola]|uniref:Cyclic-AMP phosphodiesterase n=1 Tax=Wallemia mellicola TaxID=1708541 RepID=A0A4T0LX21_9BASI|nr:hypothetical protein E3Q23_03887 [Wallemia mellicola]TIB74644.1 hypothetical protein E3Q22_04153 [Wallemia mellicola]TIB80241.1 hypothetical protein E3Q21_03854 [Wallemia mellicola]TIB84123.1 hypothetical protein E3Q20_03828 [Wallemia mellicola]TIB86789.1 hypothetical protein E3Q19_03792 [Wallemia mellicola]